MGGFTTNRTQGQGDYTGKVETYSVNASHARIIAPGDIVNISGTSDSEGRGEVDNFAAGAIAGQIAGVVASVAPQFVGENLSTTALAASVAGQLSVHIDPDLVFEADSDATLSAGDVGLNVGFNAANASGILNTSNYTIDSSSVAATVTLPLRIVKLLESSAGVLGDRALVRMNSSTLAAGTVGV